MRFLYFGRVEDGVVQFYSPALFQKACADLEGKQVQVGIDRVIDIRSMQQNKYYWGVIVKMLSAETGHTPEEMHEILKLKFNPLPKGILNKKTGEVEELVIGHTTTNLSTIEFGEYCEKIRAWAAEFFNISIPEPNEIQ